MFSSETSALVEGKTSMVHDVMCGTLFGSKQKRKIETLTLTTFCIQCPNHMFFGPFWNQSVL